MSLNLKETYTFKFISFESLYSNQIMSKMKFADSLFRLGDLGMKHWIPELRDISLSLLYIIPTGNFSVLLFLAILVSFCDSDKGSIASI